MRDTPPDLSGTATQGGYVDDTTDAADGTLTDELALSYAQATWQASTDYLQNTQRAQWERNTRLVQSRHPSDSKYLSDEYRGRTRLFRPKTRSARMKGEAAVAQAFFATQDVATITPEQDDDPISRASAALWQEALNHRLTKIVPWFQTVIGAYQDAATYGVCCSKQYWRHEQRVVEQPRVVVDEQTGMPSIVMEPANQTVKDTLWCDLYPPENVRFDPSADWRDPIESSPYVIGAMAVPAGRVKNMVGQGQSKTGRIRWREVTQGALNNARVNAPDPVELQRHANQQPPNEAQRNVRDHELVWLREYIIEFGGEDWHFYTLGDTFLLSDPAPLREVYRHGVRPYVVGYVTIEAHKTYPGSKVEMTQDLQVMANDIANLRLDNQKLGLNPKAKVVAGRNINLQAVRRHWPGEPIIVQNADDVTWDRPPDVTASAYLEQDRLNVDFDELQGSFSQSSVATNRNLNETVGGMNLLNAAAGQIGEYQLRTFAETWYERVIWQFVQLEQHYETDMTILTLAANKAKLVQRFGIDQITDELLTSKLTVNVNVGIGSTDPSQQLNRLLFAVDAYGKVMEGAVKMFGPQAAQSQAVINLGKEIFGKSGYKDGERFTDFQSPSEEAGMAGQNPMAAMQQQMQQQMQMVMQQAQQQIAQLQAQLEDKNADRQIQMQDKAEDRRMKFALETRKMQQEGMAKRAELALREQEIKGNLALKVRGQQSKEAGPAVNVRYDAQDSINQLAGMLQASTAQTALHNKAAGEALARVVAMIQDGQTTQQQVLAAIGAQIAQAQQAGSAQVAQALGALAEAVESLSKPKKVVRGKDGRAVGVETVRAL